MPTFGSAIVKGAQQATQYHRNAPVREARLAQAQLQQQKAGLELNEFVQNAPNRRAESDLKLQQLEGQVHKQNAQLLQGRTFGAFKSYGADGNVRHLNTFLEYAKTNPVGQRQYGDIARFDSLVRTTEVEAKLAQAGITDMDAFFSSPELMEKYALATTTSGGQDLIDLDKLAIGTGYTAAMDDEELRRAQARANLAKSLTGPQSAESSLIRDIAEENKISLFEATKLYNEAKRSGRQFTGSQLERVAKEFRDADPELTYEDSLRKARGVTASGSANEREARGLFEQGDYATYEEALDAVNERKERSGTQVKVDEVTKVIEEINTLAGGDIFEADMTDKKVRRQLGPKIAALEALSGKELSNEDKRSIKDLRNLLALGKTAGEKLTGAETGLLDKTLKGFRKYLTDEVGGLEASSAYETFRNIFRHSLYGAALTPSETASFNAAAGTLGQKLGPVLQQLQVQISTIKTQMESIYDTNLPEIAQYYLGKDIDEVDDIIAALDERLKMIAELQSQELVEGEEVNVSDIVQPLPGAEVVGDSPTGEVQPIEERPSLDSFFEDLN